jgi:iduronate 2-sulfatase
VFVYCGCLPEFREKFTNFELGTRVPLIISCPWKTATMGHKTSVLAELVDVYRTLADLSGVEPGVEPGVEARTHASMIEAPCPPLTSHGASITSHGASIMHASCPCSSQ